MLEILAAILVAQPVDMPTSIATVESVYEMGPPNEPVRPAIPRPTATPTSPTSPTTVPATPPEAAAPRRLHATISLRATNDYFFRGILQEDDAVILQPAAELAFDVVRSSDLDLLMKFGLWNSVHDTPTNAARTDSAVEKWYEADVYAGLAAAVGHWTFGGVYTWYTSPSDSFSTVQDLTFTVAYDDSEALGVWALAPRAAFAIETGDDYADGANSDRGLYLELGINPGLDLADTPLGDWRLSFPVAVGLSLGDYYQDASGDDDTFGYADLGVEAATELPVPDAYGDWTFSAGLHWLILGDHTKAMNSGESNELMLSAALTLSF